MKAFADLFLSLDKTNKTKEKVSLLKQYFNEVSDEDKVWTLALFSGRKPKSPVNSTLLRTWAIEAAGVSQWLFEECYHVTGDLAEVMSLLMPSPGNQNKQSLAEWIKYIAALSDKDEEEKRVAILNAWTQLSQAERFVFNKLLTGSFRVGVSQNLVVQSLSDLLQMDKSVIAHRIMGNWDPYQATLQKLIHEKDLSDDLSKPYPFFLAHPLEESPDQIGAPDEWQVEWKWDGIRAQFIKRNGHLFIWSRGEELITEKFPEFKNLCDLLPDNIVFDGELLPFHENRPMPFNLLQTRIGRKNLTAKILKEVPVAVMAYDLMEFNGEDIRSQTLAERRSLLEKLVQYISSPLLRISPTVSFQTWGELASLRELSRQNLAEGFMLKRKSSSYQVGRKRGDWWKWKIDPLSIDAVLIYAQKGHGKRADLFTDYTFGVWHEGILVPFAKAYSGLTDKEIKQVDHFIRRNTVEKFGPVRTVTPQLVFEIGFENIAPSSRHKSGVAVRFPRILKWRSDKKAEDADSLDTLKALIHFINGEKQL